MLLNISEALNSCLGPFLQKCAGPKVTEIVVTTDHRTCQTQYFTMTILTIRNWIRPRLLTRMVCAWMFSVIPPQTPHPHILTVLKGDTWSWLHSITAALQPEPPDFPPWRDLLAPRMEMDLLLLTWRWKKKKQKNEMTINNKWWIHQSISRSDPFHRSLLYIQSCNVVWYLAWFPNTLLKV